MTQEFEAGAETVNGRGVPTAPSSMPSAECTFQLQEALRKVQADSFAPGERASRTSRRNAG